ncbi:MAG: PP2C family serine/threonine-protein phosphatase [Anaerolineales bacterium]|nr:PP2C family serine/threonine-protein phosphatase [Anaerolineales bacterium]
MSFLQRLFDRFKSEDKLSPDNGTADTAPLDPDRGSAVKLVENFRRHLSYGSAQSVGIERDHNEDALFVLTGNASGHDAAPDFGLFVVADGMGGHRSGEIASALSVQTVARRLTRETVLPLMDPDSREDLPPLHDLLREALEEANRVVVENVPGGGTTLTAAVLLGEQLTLGHVGDSRAYLINGNESQVITRDHSLVERLQELGQLTPDEAAVHPQRNVLYRAIGQGENLEVDVFTQQVPQGGHLLLCSDGLWGEVDDDEIRRIIMDHGDPQQACEELVRAANAAGGPDNISAVLVYFPAAL